VIEASVNTTVVDAAADEVATSQFDVIAPHPGHLLLISKGTCSTTKLVFYSYHCHHYHHYATAGLSHTENDCVITEIILLA